MLLRCFLTMGTPAIGQSERLARRRRAEMHLQRVQRRCSCRVQHAVHVLGCGRWAASACVSAAAKCAHAYASWPWQAAYDDDASLRRVLTVRGRAGAVLGMLPTPTEQSGNVADALRKHFEAGQGGRSMRGPMLTR